ncbi:reverse transcriptase-like protein [Sphingomonas oryzagri]|uniref:Reverse transcriptase-like protein n=1 Tax=Sphingomonas oryzagri TaxID=3042314 RepID=A0ABT6MZ32_9SPHN|nr:reverse transcriptase-like protein [Sphingomonas oryzagri]MDH7638320.1 reverse transcriptase-like protein [Sphingomonas oryzagri]
MARGVKIFFDGGYRPSTGMETAIVVGGRSFIRRDHGAGNSMAAEWLALIEAMRHASERALVDPVLLGDAAAVIAQANGTARCPPSCADHLRTFLALPRPPGRVRIRYVKRSQNLAGIALAGLRDR